MYCFGCRHSADTYTLAKELLEKRDHTPYSYAQVLAWFADTRFPDKSGRTYDRGAHYIGAVHPSLVDYWHSQLDEEKYQRLASERLLTPDTVRRYKLGWRPDFNEWSIPFYRGEPGLSEIDIVQFRRTDGTEPKYIGLGGHNRGSIMNAHLLQWPQEYIVVLFGAYDPILALQDGVLAVGSNGCFPWRHDEKERVQALFEQQRCIFIVPDNTPQEYVSAYRLAEWIAAEVRLFPTDLPAGCDYIDYRKLGYSAEDFKRDVLGITPITAVDVEVIDSIVMYLRCGDPYALSAARVRINTAGVPATDIARALAQRKAFPPFNYRTWAGMRRKLWTVKTTDQLIDTLNDLSTDAARLMGAW